MRNASPTILVDTNVLVYTHDPSVAIKQQVAVDVLGRLLAAGAACVSVQCLSEFFSVSTRLPVQMPRAEAAFEVEQFARMMPVLELTEAGVLQACQAVVRHQLSIWDALIWAVARINHVPYVLTEDAEHDRVIEGVRYINPFAHTLDLDALPV
jgi:predicted nucleic acid-binding protein